MRTPGCWCPVCNAPSPEAAYALACSLFMSARKTMTLKEREEWEAALAELRKQIPEKPVTS